MSICNVCMGKGWVQGQAPDIPTACPACHGKGFIVQTNEDWFCSLPTEEKAKELANIALEAWGEGQEDKLPSDKIYMDYWKEWLKQPHTEKE